MHSVRSQDAAPMEVVVVDDASDIDMSVQRELCERFGYRWLRLENNRGPALARNVGVEQTTADWICFLDSDDEWLPGKLRTQVAWHETNPLCRISQVQEEWVKDGLLVKKPRHWEQKSGHLFVASIDRCSIGPSCVMIRRDLWEEFAGFDPDFAVCEDYELWLRLTMKNEVGLVEGEAMVRKHAGHEGQLSIMTRAMDRYRIHALLKLLMNRELSDPQKNAVAEGIRRKSEILCEGARKRNRAEWTEFYEAVASQDWIAADSSELNKWIGKSAGLLEI